MEYSFFSREQSRFKTAWSRILGRAESRPPFFEEPSIKEDFFPPQSEAFPSLFSRPESSAKGSNR
jgi:hypothetical protein